MFNILSEAFQDQKKKMKSYKLGKEIDLREDK